MHHLTKQSAVFCSVLGFRVSTSERRRENVKWPYVQHQSYKKATTRRDAASHTQMALAHLYSQEASNAHKEKMYIY